MTKRIIKPRSALVGDIVFLALGLILFILGAFVLIKGLVQEKGYIEATSHVKTVVENEDERYIIVSFDANGNTYDARLPYFDARLDISDEVIIKYNPENPEEITARRGGYVFSSILALFIGLFVFLYKGFFLLSFIKESKRVKYLIEKGIKVEAKIVACELNNKNTLYGHVPFIITATYNSGEKEYVLTSKDIYVDANFAAYNNHMVSVYSADTDFNNYYIDYTEVK